MNYINMLNNMDTNDDVTIITFDNNEKFLPICFYSHLDDRKLIELHAKCFNELGLPINYNCSSKISYMSKGEIINLNIKRLLGKVDYFLFLDIYTIPYKNDFYEKIYRKIIDKTTLYGIADRVDTADGSYQNSLPKIKPTGNIYPNIGLCAFSRILYQNLVFPSFFGSSRAEEGAEELGIRVQELGYQMNLLYPSRNYDLTEDESKQYNIPQKSPLSYGSYKSLAAEYNKSVFHLFEPKVSRGVELLENKYLDIINNQK